MTNPITTPISATISTELMHTEFLTQADPISLHCVQSKFIVLYFYPRDSTPGCTIEASDFAELYPMFIEKNTAIIGISRDSVKSHLKFAEKYNLPFSLIADIEEQLCQAFNVMRLKNMYGKQVRGIERSSFIITPSGMILKEWRKVKVEGHAHDVYQSILDLIDL